ncbi:hypothetical protein DLJ96_16770, partial [Actinotalea fermentans ATCC 43279 = JCM 9966 = DSM 3133]
MRWASESWRFTTVTTCSAARGDGRGMDTSCEVQPDLARASLPCIVHSRTWMRDYSCYSKPSRRSRRPPRARRLTCTDAPRSSRSPMELRTVTPADLPSLYALWAMAFDAPLMVPVYETDPGRLDRTVVAILPGPTPAADRVVASVCWTPRTLVGLPGPDGATTTLTVGGVANVASAPDMRGRGLIRLALAEAVARMDAAGMDASLLFTGTPGVYRPSGWETFEVPVTRGLLLPDGAARPERPGSTGVVAHHERSPRANSPVPTTFPAWDADLPWQDLATLHDAFHAAPLTTRRTAEHWEHRIPLWYSAAELLTARRPDGSIVGYLVVEVEGEVLRVRELAVGPGDATAPERRGALDVLARAARS